MCSDGLVFASDTLYTELKKKMRPLRAPLTVLLAIAVWFDISEAARVYLFGWPPNDLFYADEPGVIPIPTTEDQVAYGLILLVIGLIQAAVFWLAWKSWRAPKQGQTNIVYTEYEIGERDRKSR